jgi:hypothetical protein
MTEAGTCGARTCQVRHKNGTVLDSARTDGEAPIVKTSSEVLTNKTHRTHRKRWGTRLCLLAQYRFLVGPRSAGLLGMTQRSRRK